LYFQGSKDGQRIKELVSKGSLVPMEMTVRLLKDAIVAKPSSGYLIDGFPRAVD
jgi:UMP-CMP kinase